MLQTLLRMAISENRLTRTWIHWYLHKSCVFCQSFTWVWFCNITYQNWKCLEILFFGLKYLKFMYLLKEFVPCQHLQTVRDIFASHLQMPPLQENVHTVSLLPEMNFEKPECYFYKLEWITFSNISFCYFLFLNVILDEEKMLFNLYIHMLIYIFICPRNL